METRANYITIGAFTLLGILGALGFFVWMAKIQVNQQFDYYDILFDNVSGLSVAADVSFNGVSVGQVTKIELYDKDPSKVRVEVQVRGGTPIKTDTQAQLSAQGVTGISFVALTGGSASAALLSEASTDDPPIINGQRSVVQTLTEDVPGLLREASQIMRGIEALLGPDNRNHVAQILQNLDTASGGLEKAFTDFSSITASVASAATQVGDFTTTLTPLSASLQTALTEAEGTLEVAKSAFAQAETTLAAADAPLANAGEFMDSANRVVTDQVPAIITSLASAASTLDTAITEIRAEANTLLGSASVTSNLAGDRLRQLETTVSSLNSTLTDAQGTLRAVETAAASAQTLIDGDATALVTDARDTLAKADSAITTIENIANTDLPVIMSDVRTTVATLNRVMDQVGNDVTTFTGDLAPLISTAGVTLTTATTTFSDASAMLTRLEGSMDTVDSTLRAAEGTFTNAERVMNEDIAPITADVRKAAAQLEVTMAAVSRDVPEITAELQQTLARATEMMNTLNSVVATSGPPIAQFASTGLPQFTRFAQESRALVASLQRLTTRIDRDPARFFFGSQVPEFRR